MTDTVLETPTAAAGETPPPQPILDPEAGDDVFVAYWRPNVHLDNVDRGNWDVADGRVVAAGRRKIYLELNNPSLPPWFAGDREAAPGSGHRFADPADCYATAEDARAAARLRPPPQPPRR